MACYTISNCVLSENLNKIVKYTLNLLLVFFQENDHEIAVDENGKIIDIYSTVLENISDDVDRNCVTLWLYLLKLKLPKWGIPIDSNDEDIFMAVCCSKRQCVCYAS